jgi:N4-gp56 family major capsid protein
MALTTYGVNAPEAVKLWSDVLSREALKATWINKFIGRDANALIQEKTDFKKSAGDRLTVLLRMQLTGDGVLGDGTLEGNEERLATYADNLLIDQLRHAVRSGGKMTEQRIPFSIREEAKDGLKDWIAGRMDTAFFNHLCGYTPQTDLRYTGNNAVLAPTTFVRGGGVANDQSLTTGGEFTLGLIDSAVARAKTATPVMRPLKMDGEDKYVMFLHPFQVQQMRTNTSAGQWLDIQKAAVTGDGSRRNPIFTGALGEYNGVILHESTRITNGVNSSTGAAVANTRRAVLAGAQAMLMGFGRSQNSNATSWDWVEKLFDYENQLGVAAGAIFGMKASRFGTGSGGAAADFSKIVVSTYTPELA